MNNVKFVIRQEDGAWLGHLLDYPDCWTQDLDVDDLIEHPRDLCKDLRDTALVPSP